MAPLLAALSATPAAALTINGFTAAGNERFASGYPGAPVANTSSSFIGAGYNWSGVGWTAGSSNWSFALLGPDQVLIANHVRGDVGPTIQFTNASGQVFNFTVASEQGTHSGYTNDLATATLATPIPASDNIQYYSILFQGYAPATYVGDNLLLYGNYEGQGPAVGWNQISQAGQLLQNASGSYGPDYSNYLYYGYDSVSPNRTVVQNGDSGSPTFIVTGVKGQMYLAGAHYALNSDDSGNPIGGYDSFTSLSLPTLDADMGPSGYLPYVVTPVTARWNGGTSSSWATAANWSSTSGTASVPGDLMSGGSVAVCASVEFDGAATTPHTITLDGAQTVTSITFASAAGANGFTLTGANTLTIGEAGLTNLDDDVQTLACPVALRTSQRWTIGSGGLAVTGSINLGSGTTGNLLLVEGSGSAVFSGALSGSTGSLAVDGGATLTLNSSAGNSYGGSTFINGATLVISQDNDLGAAPSVTASNQLSIDGGTLQAAATLALNANRGIALGNLGGTLAVVGGATLTGNSPIAGSGAALAVAGPGSVVLTASNSYSGPTTVSDGVLTLSGSGSIAKSSGYTVGEGTLRLDNSAGTLATNRTNTAATIALQGGTLQIVAAGATTATLGNLSAVAGENVYTLSTTNTANTLVVSNGTLSRSVGATVNFTGTFNSTNRITFSGLSGFIDQGTFANGADFAAYDTTLNTIRALEYGIDPNTAAVGAIAAGDHVKLTATPAAQNSLTLLTLNLAGSGVSFPLAGGQTLVLSDGGLLKSGGGAAGTLSGGGLATAAGVELVVRTDTAADSLTISTPIAVAGALTKSGAGLLVLSSTANSYGGPTTVTAGTLALGAAQTLPATSTLALAGSGVFDLAGYSQTVAGLSLFDGTITNSNRGNPATLWLGGNSGAVLYDGVGGGATIAADNFMLATSSAAAGSHVFTIARGLGVSDLTVTSAIGNGSAAPQSLVKSGPGILTLSGSNTYTGATDVLAGTLALGRLARPCLKP